MNFLANSANLNPAHVLWLVREKRVQSLRDLDEYFHSAPSHPGKPELLLGKSEILTRSVFLRELLGRFIAAGLIEGDESYFSPSPNIEKIQVALGLSLVELAEKPFGAIWVNPIWGKVNDDSEKPDVFVLMPFSRDLQPVYEKHILKVCKELQLKTARADDLFTTKSVVLDIWNAIFNSKIIIADCTGRNPNVFYEIGIAHTIGKPVILITQNLGDVPSDLRHMRFIEYEYTRTGMTVFEKALAKTLKTEYHNIKV